MKAALSLIAIGLWTVLFIWLLAAFPLAYLYIGGGMLITGTTIIIVSLTGTAYEIYRSKNAHRRTVR